MRNGRVVLGTKEFNTNEHQFTAVTQAFTKMNPIPAAAHGRTYFHHSSLLMVRKFVNELLRLRDTTPATDDWAVGYTYSGGRKSVRYNMEWRDDGSMLKLTSPVTVKMLKKNLRDPHLSDQKWLSETCRHHTPPFMQARLGDWIEYGLAQIAKLEGWEYNQKLGQISAGVTNSQKKLDEMERKIESLHAYITQLDDPTWIKSYIDTQKQGAEDQIETLEKRFDAEKVVMAEYQARVDEFVESGA